MTKHEARQLAHQTFGAGVRLVSSNGVCCVELAGERLGMGPSWKAALKRAVLAKAGVQTADGLSELVAHEELEQMRRKAEEMRELAKELRSRRRRRIAKTIATGLAAAAVGAGLAVLT